MVAACGARSFDPAGLEDGDDGGPVLQDAGPWRVPYENCDGNEVAPDVSWSRGHYDILQGVMELRFGVAYCGPGPLEQSVLAWVLRIEADESETILYEGRTHPGLPSGFEEYLVTTIPYTDRDCIRIEIDPLAEVDHCGYPHCNLYDLQCPPRPR